MISAYARGALTLGDAPYAARAARAADFVLAKLRENGRLRRSFKDGEARYDAYLDDYAFLIAGLLDLYEATSEIRWLREAIALDGMLQKHYEDTGNGAFFMTSDDQAKLIVREKPGYDGAEPSGNSVQTINLLRLAELTSARPYAERAERTLQTFRRTLAGNPSALSEMLMALDFRYDSPKEIVIVTPKTRSEAEPFLERLRRTFVPNRVMAVVVEGADQAAHTELVPIVREKRAQRGAPTAYVCEHQSCDLPTADPDVFARLIQKVRRFP